MVYRITMCAAALVSSLFLSTAATPAQTVNASVSGPANGTNVEPSTAVQKQTEGRSVSGATMRTSPDTMGSALAAGAPGVEGAPGTQSGR